jgi:uncharacterized protein (TIGR02217 family)
MTNVFDEIQLPTNYDYGAKLGAGANTHKFKARSGFEYRNQRWRMTRGKYVIDYSVTDYASLGVLKAFYLCRQGNARGFRFKNLYDFSSAADGQDTPTMLDQPVLIDSNGNLRLAKVYGSGSAQIVRWIIKPVAGSVAVALNGSPVSPTIDYTSGILTFGSFPSGNLTAGYLYDTPVRFDSGIDFSAQQYNTGAALQLILRELLFNISIGSYQLAFAASPANGTTGAQPTMNVVAQDYFGNIVTTDTSTVSLNIGVGPGGASIGGTSTVAIVNGVATFTDVVLSTAGTYSLTAEDGNLVPGSTLNFVI